MPGVMATGRGTPRPPPEQFVFAIPQQPLGPVLADAVARAWGSVVLTEVAPGYWRGVRDVSWRQQVEVLIRAQPLEGGAMVLSIDARAAFTQRAMVALVVTMLSVVGWPLFLHWALSNARFGTDGRARGLQVIWSHLTNALGTPRLFDYRTAPPRGLPPG